MGWSPDLNVETFCENFAYLGVIDIFISIYIS
jgi:hypothetical protein